MKANYPSLAKILVLFLILSMFTVGFAVPSPRSSVTAQTTPDPGLDEYGGWKGLQGHNTTGHWTVELIGDRYWFVTPENNVLWVLGHQHCTTGPTWQNCTGLGYAPTALVNDAKYPSVSAWAKGQLGRSQDWGFNSTLIMDWSANVPNISRFAVLDVKWLAQDPSAGVRVDDYFVDVFNPRYAAECAKRAEALLRPLVNDPWTIGVYLGNEQAWNGRENNEIGLPNMFIKLPPTAAGKQYWVNVFLKTRYPTVDNLNSAYGTKFHSWDDVLQCTSIPDTAVHPCIHEDKVGFSGDIAEAYYKPMVAAARAVAPRLLILSDRMLPIDIVKYLDYNERIWKVAGEYCDVFCINSYLDYVKLEQTDHIISDMMAASGKPILITEHSYTANDTSLPLHGGYVGGNIVASQTDRASSYVDYLNGLLSMKVKGPDGRSVNPFMGIVWHKWYDDAALGVSSSNNENYNFGLLDGMDEAYTPLVDVMKNAHSQVYDAIVQGKPISIMAAPALLAPTKGLTTAGGAEFSWTSVQNAASYTLLISTEKAFPDEQTIRVDGIHGTSWTLDLPLASGHFWWTVRASEENPDYGGYYAHASEFMFKDSIGPLDSGLGLERLNRISFEDIWDSGGAVSSCVFADTTDKSAGTASARCVFTAWATNKTGDIGRNDASVFVNCAGATEPWTGMSLAVRPTSFCDTSDTQVPSSKYLRIRAWDQSGKLFLEWPLDPEGGLPVGKWSTVTIPFGEIGPQSVSKIAIVLVKDQDKLARDQRLTINIDTVVPLTTADDATAPPAPFITDLKLSDGILSVNLDATDPESGIRQTQVSVGKTPGGGDLLPWTTAGDDLSLSVPFTAAGTSPWYISAEAQNGAGAWSAMTIVDGNQWNSSTKVTSLAEEHGSLTPAGTVLIPSGNAQTFSTVPDFGYGVQDIIVDGVSAGTQPTVTVHGDGKPHSVVARFMFSNSAWSLDHLPAEAKTIISMPIGSTTYQKNGTTMTLDVPPFISSGRTLVPMRAISEGLGADVEWDAATRTVTLSFEGLDGPHVIEMVTGEIAFKLDGEYVWMDVESAIVAGRTFVPLRAVSEAFGAKVNWDGATRTVLTEGVNVNSTPLNNGKTLKGLYRAGREWDANGNGIRDAVEPFFDSRETSDGIYERTLNRTEVLARTDDTTAISELPALSPVVPIGVHRDLIKVRYNGQLTGYIAAGALEQRARDLPSASDTEKWVVGSGPSLQSFLNNALATQGAGDLTAGQSLTVLGNTVTGTSTGSEPFGFETWKTIDVPTGAPNSAFGIQFRITRTMSLSPNPLDTKADILDEPFLYFMSYGNGGNGEWWNGTRRILIELQRRWALDGDSDQNHLVSDGPVLRSGQLYEIRFPDGTGGTAVITLPDGTAIDTLDTTKLTWNDKGGCFPDHKFTLGIWISPRSSITISDLAFVVPPTAP